jgi:hypothetical protein
MILHNQKKFQSLLPAVQRYDTQTIIDEYILRIPSYLMLKEPEF